MFKAANRAIDLVRQILSISRQAEQKRKPIKLDTIIIDVVRLLKATLPVSISIKENIIRTNRLDRGKPGPNPSSIDESRDKRRAIDDGKRRNADNQPGFGA